jgi:hypothetical protein
MTKKEWLIHMLDGGKGVSDFTLADGEYIIFDSEDGKFKYSTGSDACIEYHESDFAEYEEPKKKIKVAPYLFKYDDTSNYANTTVYFKDDMTFLKLYQDLNLKFKRLTALEIEVDEY